MPGSALTQRDIIGQLQETERLLKAYTSADVASGPQLVRQDLQSVIALAGNPRTPVRNLLNRIQGNGSAHMWFKLEPIDYVGIGSFYGTSPVDAAFMILPCLGLET